MLIFETLSYRNFLSTGDKPTVIQLNKNTATLEKFYYKSDIDDHIKYADDVAKVYSFKKK